MKFSPPLRTFASYHNQKITPTVMNRPKNQLMKKPVGLRRVKNASKRFAIPYQIASIIWLNLAQS
jgi:hypothetical protein